MIARIPGAVSVLLIKLYQKTLSMDHGPMRHLYPNGFCRFTPTCSQYGIEAITMFGMIRGSAMTAWRILRCNPWNEGGNDDPCKEKGSCKL